jgi:RNA ligase (TIGR02306 family)
MESKSTHAVEIVPVVLERHPNADSLSVVRVWNFTVVVRTEDWIGVEKAAYVPPDNILPDKPEYRFLKNTSVLRKEREELETKQVLAGDPRCGNPHWELLRDYAPEEYAQKLAAIEAKIDANTKHLRITVKKLRGIVSMGMLLPAPEGSQIGDDVAGQLGVTHYEPPSMEEIGGRRQHAGDDVAPAPPMIYAPAYDVESIYKYADCFEAGEPVYVSEKIHGQNGRFVATDNGNETVEEHPETGYWKWSTPVTLHAGSRTEWKKKEGGSNWWKVQEQNPWIEKWCYDNQDCVLYGEVFGWVQALKYGAKPGQLFFRAFDVVEGTEFWDAERFLAEIPKDWRVPCLGVMPFDFEGLQALADGTSLVPGAANQMREGIVIKPLKERKHWKLGRVVLKLVSNEYLEKSNR